MVENKDDVEVSTPVCSEHLSDSAKSFPLINAGEASALNGIRNGSIVPWAWYLFLIRYGVKSEIPSFNQTS